MCEVRGVETEGLKLDSMKKGRFKGVTTYTDWNEVVFLCDRQLLVGVTCLRVLRGVEVCLS